MGSGLRFRFAALVGWGCWSCVGAAAVGAAEDARATSPGPVDYTRDVRPILAETCYACHGPDEETREARLRLDERESVVDRRRGPRYVVRPGRPERSLLYRVVTAEDPDDRMPPAESGKSLSAAQVETLRRWIAEGAQWTEHWSYVPPSRPPLPEVRDASWARTPVDRFIRARLEKEGVEPAPEADRATLLRRLTLDLTGLPPEPDDVDAFLADRRADAWERRVEGLLDSPGYGERMAVFWLDLVRFADTRGYHSDNPRNVGPYRDWVIEAFRRNMAFDRFTVAQIAGDLLPDATTEDRVASCYNKLNKTTEEGGAQPGEYEAKNAADRVRNLGDVWLGATLGCAECHDHKYDPYRTRDFYSMAAFFADVREPAIMDRDQGIPLPTPREERLLASLDARNAALRRAIEGSPSDLAGVAPRQAALERLQERRKRLDGRIRRCLVTVSGPPRTVRVLPRGNWMDGSGEVVEPAIPRHFGTLRTEGRRATRLDLARWLTSPENPLTARVLVNRIWRLFFGEGISRLVEDLGAMGEVPDHPELLDWLAVELVESGWDVQHIVRLLVTSSAYRQVSVATDELRRRDPYNRWLARQGSWRLDAELVRDGALAVSGLLDRRVGGESAKPYQPAGYWANLNFPKRKWVADQGTDAWRRGLYTWWQRSFVHPSLMAFDAPNREECVARRSRSNIPQQALVLLNDPTYVEAARVLAERMVREGGATPEARIRWAFRRATARTPDAEEVAILRALQERHRDAWRGDRAAAGQLVATGQAPVPDDIDAVDLAAWTSVARAILNLHETITRS